MGRAYSLDLRERVARHVAEGGSRREAGRRFGVSASTAVRIAASQAVRGTLAPRRQGRPPGRGKLAAYLDFLVELVEAVPDITMPELARALEAEHGVKAHPSSISRALIRADMTYKKSLIASERERADVRAARAEWTLRRQPRMREEPHRLVFVDECGTRTNMTRLRGRARRGARVRDHAPLRHKGTQTFVAGLRDDRLVAPWLLDGPMNRAAFDVWVETQLAPELGKGDVVILDNLAVHRSPKAAEILRAKGAWFLFLPPYSPDLNPIEMAFSKLKAHLRRIGARTLDALWRAVGEVCGLFDPDECWSYFKKAGYVSD